MSEMMALIDTLENVALLPMETVRRLDNGQLVFKIIIKHGPKHKRESTITIPKDGKQLEPAWKEIPKFSPDP